MYVHNNSTHPYNSQVVCERATNSHAHIARQVTGNVSQSNSVVEPPYTKRGVDSANREGKILAVGIHWLAGTTYLELDDVLAFVHDLTRDSFVVLDYGHYAYTKTCISDSGIRIYHTPSCPETMPSCLVVASGEACEILGYTKCQELASIIKPTRVDVAFDTDLFSPRQLRDAAFIDKNIRTKAQRKYFSFIERGDAHSDTLYIGSRSSTQQLCVYNKRGFTRVEHRLTGERAEKFSKVLRLDADAFKLHALGLLRGFVDFIDRGKEKNLSRCELLPFWAEFCGSVERFVMNVAGKVAMTPESIKAWLYRQVAPVLALFDRIGGDINDLISSGASRFRHRHNAVIAQYNASCR